MSDKLAPEVRAVYNRVYERHDILRPAVGWKIGLGVVALWALFGVVNVLFFARTIENRQLRLLRSFAFGPAFVPLHVEQGQETVMIGPLPVPVGAATLIGALPLGIAGLCIFAGQETRDRRGRQRRAAVQHAVAQGRLLPRDVRKNLRLTEAGVPLALIEGQPIGIPQDRDAGHVAIIAPTRSGKGLHLTEVLLRWVGPAVVLDPKSEQWERTAGERDAQVGPVYEIPRDGLDLLDYYDLRKALDLKELHTHLLRTDRDTAPIFGEKSLAIFQAAAITGRATGQHPLRLLATWAEMPSTAALTEAAIHASAEVARFTDGTAPEQELNRFASSAWGTFTTRFAPYISHIQTVSTPTIPRTWLDDGATIYICYPLDQLEAASGLVAAIFAGLLKGHMRQRTKIHALYAIDEAPTVSIYNIDTHLSTVGGYGATLLLYIQALSQLDDRYGIHRARTILGNCHHQIYYPPRDPYTERHIADLFGSELYFIESESHSQGTARAGTPGGKALRSTTSNERERPALARASQLPHELVAVASEHYRVIAERMNPIPKLATLPVPPPYRVVYTYIQTPAALVRTSAPAARGQGPAHEATTAPLPAGGDREHALSSMLPPREPTGAATRRPQDMAGTAPAQQRVGATAEGPQPLHGGQPSKNEDEGPLLL